MVCDTNKKAEILSRLFALQDGLALGDEGDAFVACGERTTTGLLVMALLKTKKPRFLSVFALQDGLEPTTP